MNSSQGMFTGGGTLWKLGTFFGNKIFVQPFFLLLIALLSFSGINSYSGLLAGLFLAPLLVFSVIFHELAHALTSKYFGYGTSTIVLHGFGGVAINHSNKRREPLKNCVITAAGPLSSAFLGIIGLLLYKFALPMIPIDTSLMGYVTSIVYSFMFLNFILAIFNALPIFPLDGGHFVKEILHHLNKNEYKATKTAVYISMATLFITSFFMLFVLHAGIFTVVILGMLFFQNWQMLKSLQ